MELKNEDFVDVAEAHGQREEIMRAKIGFTQDELTRLEEIYLEFKQLLEEVSGILPDTIEGERARGYWFAHIAMALDNQHEFVGECMQTMSGTIDEMRSLLENEK